MSEGREMRWSPGGEYNGDKRDAYTPLSLISLNLSCIPAPIFVG
ncbi:MAG: hypothetical protein ACJ71R_14490 [Nitrososphaeraceae archaeon]